MPTAGSKWPRKMPDTPARRARVEQYRSPEHRRRRQAGQRDVDAGRANCWRCGRWLPPGQPWHVGHDDYDRTIYRGTECVPCNLDAAARANAASRRGTYRHASTALRW